MRTQGAKVPPKLPPVAQAISDVHALLEKVVATRAVWAKINEAFAAEQKQKLDMLIAQGFDRREAMRLLVALLGSK